MLTFIQIYLGRAAFTIARVAFQLRKSLSKHVTVCGVPVKDALWYSCYDINVTRTCSALPAREWKLMYVGIFHSIGDPDWGSIQIASVLLKGSESFIVSYGLP